ncbi:hypothetical protein BDM02DRAFT_3112617 [Thelephora ganbajun]|uniref:Uncharacterized protein n=1 Tax=Thelephora ganbajun TaxID=370292 RepID=A0ACB6ZKD9_THEGA|nr:hypothetical protein BDM02DRAFT_3112617 [Thelephora ganbajun]
MQSHKNIVTNTNSNHNRRRKPWRQPHKEPVVVNPPAVSVQPEDWGSTADPWPGTIDESDVSKEIISVWRQNVFAAENGGQLQKMEDLYNRLDRERERWNERLNNPLTWGWGAGQPDELNDWARETKVTVSPGWGDYNPDDFDNWADDPVCEHTHWHGRQQANSDKTPDGVPNTRNPEQTSLPNLVSSYADKLKADGRERSYAFAQLPVEAKAEKIREFAHQLKGSKKH